MLKKPSKVSIISVISVIIAAPLCVFLCFMLSDKKSYYSAAVLLILCAIVPFFAFFEKRKVKTGEIVTLAIMTALAVASRCVMMFIPQVKPTCALVAVSGIAFGPHVGFLIGALSMLLSNFVFGQGVFTPFQMLGMGLVGFISGALFCGKKYATNKWIVSISVGLLCFAVYGFTVDTCSVLMMSTDLSIKSALPFYASGLTFNIIHGVTTAVLLFFINKPMTDKFSRLRIKYGIFQRTQEL